MEKVKAIPAHSNGCTLYIMYCVPVQVIQNGDQEVLVELEGIRELFRHLPHTVYELNEDGRSLVIPVVLVTVTNALCRQKRTLHN